MLKTTFTSRSFAHTLSVAGTPARSTDTNILGLPTAVSSNDQSHYVINKDTAEITPTYKSNSKFTSWSLIGSAIGGCLAAAIGVLSGGGIPLLNVSLGLIAGAALGKIADFYRLPPKLYHFTSLQNSRSISKDKVIHKSLGHHGVGVYATRFKSPLIATLQRARSTEVAFEIPTQGMSISRTWIPGTFRINNDVPTDKIKVCWLYPHPSMAVRLLHHLHWRDITKFFYNHSQQVKKKSIPYEATARA